MKAEIGVHTGSGFLRRCAQMRPAPGRPKPFCHHFRGTDEMGTSITEVAKKVERLASKNRKNSTAGANRKLDLTLLPQLWVLEEKPSSARKFRSNGFSCARQK